MTWSTRLINRPLVPVQAEPAQFIDRLLVGPFLDARDVEVINAKYDPPTVLSGHEPIGQESSGIAEMESAGGRGRQPRHAHGSFDMERGAEKQSGNCSSYCRSRD